MQAPKFSRAVEQRSTLGQSSAVLDRSGQYAVSMATFHLGIDSWRFSGCSCSHSGLRRRPSRKCIPSPELHSVLSRGMLGSRTLSGFHHARSGKGWISSLNFWREPLVAIPKCLNAVEKTKSDDEGKIMGRFLPLQKISIAGLQWSGTTLTKIILSFIVLAAPAPSFTDSSLTFSDSARADQLGQLKQAASFLEKAAEGFTKVRYDGEVGLQVLDKAVTVVTGSTFIDPTALQKEVDAVLHGEKDIQEELRSGINNAVQTSWSTVIDVFTNLNPSALSESAGASISTFLETGAERVAAFELSALVSLGERWLILTPLLVLPMAWEMNRLKKKSERELREGQQKFEALSGQSQLRGEKVRRELERIELRTLLLDAVGSLGKAALQPARTRVEAGLIRVRIKDMLNKLEELKPIEDPVLLVPEIASTLSASSAPPGDSLPSVPTNPTVDGDWNLIYVSEPSDSRPEQEMPQFPGIGLDNLRQKVWQTSSILSLTPDNDIPSPSPLLARNTADIRLGPLGVFQVAVQGSWENLKDGQRALVSFNTFSARPLEILGNKISDDIPEFNVSLPPALQRSAEWAVVYVDNHMRINRGSQGRLYLFEKAGKVYN